MSKPFPSYYVVEEIFAEGLILGQLHLFFPLATPLQLAELRRCLIEDLPRFAIDTITVNPNFTCVFPPEKVVVDLQQVTLRGNLRKRYRGQIKKTFNENDNLYARDLKFFSEDGDEDLEIEVVHPETIIIPVIPQTNIDLDFEVNVDTGSSHVMFNTCHVWFRPLKLGEAAPASQNVFEIVPETTPVFSNTTASSSSTISVMSSSIYPMIRGEEKAGYHFFIETNGAYTPMEALRAAIQILKGR